MSWRAAIRVDLDAFTLEVDIAGGVRPLAIVGENGSGKTTLLRAIAGAVTPRSGRIEAGGAVLFDERDGTILPPEARRVGYVPQGYGLFPHLSVLDNVAFGLAVGSGSIPRPKRVELARAALAELDAAELATRMPAGLSGGEAQRVALARALVIEPRILLMDEPLAALDATARRAVRSFLAARLRELARPSVIVTHDVRDVQALGAEVVVLDAGRVVQRGTLDELRSAPASAFVAEFCGLEGTP